MFLLWKVELSINGSQESLRDGSASMKKGLIYARTMGGGHMLLGGNNPIFCRMRSWEKHGRHWTRKRRREENVAVTQTSLAR